MPTDIKTFYTIRGFDNVNAFARKIGIKPHTLRKREKNKWECWYCEDKHELVFISPFEPERPYPPIKVEL